LPIFGDSPTPVQIRILMAIALTFCLFPIIGQTWQAATPVGPWGWLLIVGKELLIGLMIGYVAKLVFDGLVMASSLVAYQMGFGMSNLMIPDAGAQMDSFTAFHRCLVMLIFLGLNLHLMFMKSMADTFRLIPAGMVDINNGLGQSLIQYTAAVFATGLQLAAPVIIALLFTMAALGLMARAVPQMNVFTLSFPISFFIGILVYIASLPFFPDWMSGLFEESYENVYTVIRGLAPV